MSANYSEVLNNVKSAIRVDSDTLNKWAKAGESVAEFYQSAKALEEVKAQFIADAILPCDDCGARGGEECSYNCSSNWNDEEE